MKEKSLLLDDNRSLYFCHLTILLRCQWEFRDEGNNNIGRIWASETKDKGSYRNWEVFSTFCDFFWSRSLSKLQLPGTAQRWMSTMEIELNNLPPGDLRHTVRMGLIALSIRS